MDMMRISFGRLIQLPHVLLFRNLLPSQMIPIFSLLVVPAKMDAMANQLELPGQVIDMKSDAALPILSKVGSRAAVIAETITSLI